MGDLCDVKVFLVEEHAGGGWDEQVGGYGGLVVADYGGELDVEGFVDCDLLGGGK